MVEKFKTKYGLNKSLKIIGLNKQTYYNNRGRQDCSLKRKYKKIENVIRKILIENPGYGYRRLLIALKRKRYIINHKTLRKLLKERKLGFLQRKNRIKRKSGIERILEELGARVNLVRGMNQIKLFEVIYTDFTEIVYGYGSRKTYLIVYLEAVSRKILSYNLDSATSKSAIKAYNKTKRYLLKRGVKLKEVIVHQDQGSQFKSYAYVGRLLKDDISLSYSRKGHFEDNPEMESFFGRFKDEWREEIYEIETFKELKEFVKRKIIYYNKYRIHSSLGEYSPDEFIKIHHDDMTKIFLKKG